MPELPHGEAVMNISTPIAAAALEPSPHDLGNAATLIALELSRAEANIAKIIDQLNANVDKKGMLSTMHNYLSDCCGELVGPINDAAETLRGDLYGVSTRGPMYRRR